MFLGCLDPPLLMEVLQLRTHLSRILRRDSQQHLEVPIADNSALNREGVQDRKRLVRIALVILPATYVACLLVAFFKCVPFQNQWQIYPNPGSESSSPRSHEKGIIYLTKSIDNCMPAISSLQTVFVMVMNTITDFYLMAIPLPVRAAPSKDLSREPAAYLSVFR